MPNPHLGSIFAFLIAWEAMVLAMMLPGSLRFLLLFRALTRDHPARGACRAAMCAGYALAWAIVGWIVLASTVTIYRFADVDSWLDRHGGLFAGFALLSAGGFQLTPLKRRCLAVCSRPESFLMRHYRRGTAAALDLGVRYGIVCVGCCWALMMLMVIFGASSLYAMVVLGGSMFAERMFGRAVLRRLVALACQSLGIAVAFSPGTAPVLVRNARSWTDMGAMQPTDLAFWCHA